MYFITPTGSARETFKINASEAFKQPFHLALTAQPKLSFQRFTCATGEAFKNDASEAVCIFVSATAALVFLFIITEARANPAKPLRLLLRIA
ncbi:hypothetical protein AID78_003815, partial [Salmonella enterica subsp. enterica serovar Java]|nr:hypothetical protein [Salmonella enterica subsp. enterica serovar Java]